MIQRIDYITPNRSVNRPKYLISHRFEDILIGRSVTKACSTDDRPTDRLNTLGPWMFCNAALVAIVLNTGGLNRLSVHKDSGEDDRTVKIYLFVVLWSVAGLSAFKFVGAMWYRIFRIVSI